MIIVTFSDEETLLAQKTRDLLTTMGRTVVLVPYGITGLHITIDENEGKNELVVYACDDQQDLDIARGFNSLQECRDYAKIVVAEAGLTEEDIDSDVWEVE